MTNLVILLLTWCTGIVLLYAFSLARNLRQILREEVVAEAAGDHPVALPAEGAVLSYARRPTRYRLLRRWPIISALVVAAFMLLFLMPLALPILGNIYLNSYREVSVVCGCAIGLTLIAMIVVAQRGLNDINGRPAAVNWVLGRTMLCWIGIFVITWAALDWRTRHILDAMLARADEVGRRLEIKSADGTLAAADYQHAGFGSTKPFEFDDDWSFMTYLGQMSAPPSFPAAHAFRIPLLQRAAARQVSGLNPPASEYTIGTPLPHLAQFRRAAVLLNRHALAEARAGRIESAIADINAMHGMANQMSQGLTLIESLVSCGIDHLAMDALQHVLPFVHDERLLDLIHLPSSAECMPEIRRGLEGDVAIVYRRTLAQLLRGQLPLGNVVGTAGPRTSSDGPGLLRILYRVPMGEIDAGLVDEFATLVPKMISDDPAVAAAGGAGFNARVQSMRSNSLFIGVLVPSIGRSVDRFVELAAMCDLSRAAVASTRFRLQKGRLPTSFDELVQAGLLPTVPIDPFNGKPMCFAIHEGYVFIYTIGANRTNGGGTPYIAKTNGEVIPSNPGFILSARPLWELDLVPPGAAGVTTQPAE